MSYETIGVYAFITPDWKLLGYPFDLWLEHHSSIFDQISIVTYGNVEIPFHKDNIIIKRITSSPDKTKFSFYTIGKTEAQINLQTDWKILLDVDEFMVKKPAVHKLDRSKSYIMKYINLYGNIFTEIKCVSEFAIYARRLHYGNRNIEGDGAQVSGPTSYKVVSEFFHTNAIRKPAILSIKWREQIMREINEGYHRNENRLKYLQDDFNFSLYKTIWPGSFLILRKREEIPKILIDNKERFANYNFGSIPFAYSTKFTRVKELYCNGRVYYNYLKRKFHDIF